MRIAFVSQPWDYGFPPTESIAILIWEMGRRLAASPREHEVIVYARTDPDDERDELHEGVTYRYLPIRFPRTVNRMEGLAEGRPGLRLFASSLYHADYALEVARDLREQPCDLVVVNNFSQFLPVVRRANRTARVFLYMHCDWLSTLNTRRLARRLRHADLVLGVSDWVTEGARTALPVPEERFATLHPGVDTVAFSPGTPSRDRRRKLVFVNRISPEKGVHILLEAFEKVLEQVPDVELDIVGDEQVVPEEMLVALSDDWRVQDLRRFYGRSYREILKEQLSPAAASRVTFSGWIPRPEVADHFRSADIYVSASLWEPFGLGVVEAMACRLPVVATRVGGMTETVDEGSTGFLVEPGDPAALAEPLVRLLQNDELRLAIGAAGRRRVLKRFTWDRAVEMLLTHYERCQQPIAGPRGRVDRNASRIAAASSGQGRPSPRP
ncbi:MAG: glycosyltransferase family 4 protein [Actinomycetota bacterium]|nr:glycosyltransferase family 4 protein [Actinomycetota bacterium]